MELELARKSVTELFGRPDERTAFGKLSANEPLERKSTILVSIMCLFSIFGPDVNLITKHTIFTSMIDIYMFLKGQNITNLIYEKIKIYQNKILLA